MEQIVEQIKVAIAAAVNLIKSQKVTIGELRTKLSEVSEEYSQYKESDATEDAATEAVFNQLEEIANTLSAVVADAKDEE